MLNFRRIDNNYFLSGGWTDLKYDLLLLQDNRIKAVLDLQYTPEDDSSMPLYIQDQLEQHEIFYSYIPMHDWEVYTESQLDSIFKRIDTVLDGYEEELKPTSSPKFYPSGKPYLAGSSPRKYILVKCGTGTSRSAAGLLYHLCVKNKSSYLEELWELRDKEKGKTEFGASPNPSFAAYLNKKFPDEDYS